MKKNSFQDSLKYLYSLQKTGIKFGLQNIAGLLASIGNPHGNFPTIHIAGTNGKGSTASMIAAILTSAGYKTGLYTSPHLVSFTERIRIDGKQIPEKIVGQYTQRLRPVIQELDATFFEVTTAIAFKYFSDEKVDVAVVETGLGGRLDATNILSPLITIITSIDYDHMDLLGKSLSAIAREKAGIMKPITPLITGETKENVLKVFKKTAVKLKVPISVVGELTEVLNHKHSLTGTVATIRTPLRVYKNIRIGLTGHFQIINASMAILCVELLTPYFKIPVKAIQSGLENTRMYSGLRGRMEILSKRPLVMLDCAHNPQGIQQTITAVRSFFDKKVIIVFGVMEDKDYSKMMDLLIPITQVLVAVEAKTKRALKAKEILREAKRRGMSAMEGPETWKGLERAIRLADRTSWPILVIGSNYVIGEIIRRYES